MRCRAKKGMFCGYPKDTSDGVYTHYFTQTSSTQDSRHCVMDEYYDVRHAASQARRVCWILATRRSGEPSNLAGESRKSEVA